MTSQTQTRPLFGLILHAVARTLRHPFRRKVWTAEEVLALWESQKHHDALAQARHEAIVRHFHRM